MHRDARQVDAGAAGRGALPALRARRARADGAAAARRRRCSRPRSRRAALINAIARRQPVGVVACITSYNFPIVNMVGKIAPALAMGNTVIVRPAGQDPLAIVKLVKLLEDVGFPPGVVNVVTGSTPESGEALVASPDVDMVSFTGSSGVGAPHRRGRGPGHEAPAARARRQGRRARARRRRREERDRHDRLGVDVPRGPDLHRADAGDRAPVDLRPRGRGPGQDGRRSSRSATRSSRTP